MQCEDGSLREINEKAFRSMFGQDGDNAKVIKEGDVFKVRGCFFRVTNIGIARDQGVAKNHIEAVGITEAEFRKTKNTPPTKMVQWKKGRV